MASEHTEKVIDAVGIAQAHWGITNFALDTMEDVVVVGLFLLDGAVDCFGEVRRIAARGEVEPFAFVYFTVEGEQRPVLCFVL